MAELAAQLKVFRSSRGVLKRKITETFKQILKDDPENIKVNVSVIEQYLKMIEDYDSKINNLVYSEINSDGEVEDGEEVDELSKQVSYLSQGAPTFERRTFERRQLSADF